MLDAIGAGQSGGSAMRTTILAYAIAIVGLAMIVAGVVEVALSDYAIAVALIGVGIGLIGLAQALRLLLEINDKAAALPDLIRGSYRRQSRA